MESALINAAPVTSESDPASAWARLLAAYSRLQLKLDRRLDVSAIGAGMVRGMLARLRDPLTAYLDLPTLERLRSGEPAGAGLVLTSGPDTQLQIRAVVPDGPAAQAGLKPGDLVLAINDRPPGGVYAAVEMLVGPAGSPVTVRVQSPDDLRPREVVLQRAHSRLAASTVESRAGVRYVGLRAFEPGTADLIRRTLLDTASARGWVIDVRGNGEGSIAEAVNLASLFLGDQIIALEEDRSGRRAPIRGVTRRMSEIRPLAVLVDSATAGPAELLAAALQDYRAAVVIGTPSSGRMGTTTGVPLSDGSIVQLASGRYLSPSGGRLLGEGVRPDVEVHLTPAALAAGQDPQLERALELL